MTHLMQPDRDFKAARQIQLQKMQPTTCMALLLLRSRDKDSSLNALNWRATSVEHSGDKSEGRVTSQQVLESTLEQLKTQNLAPSTFVQQRLDWG